MDNVSNIPFSSFLLSTKEKPEFSWESSVSLWFRVHFYRGAWWVHSKSGSVRPHQETTATEFLLPRFLALVRLR